VSCRLLWEVKEEALLFHWTITRSAMRLTLGFLWDPHFGSRKSKTLLTSVRPCAVVTGDPFSLTDSWRRPSGGDYWLPSQKKRCLLIRPSLSSCCPPTFPLLLCIEEAKTAGQEQQHERANNNSLHWITRRIVYIHTKKKEGTIFMPMTISCFNLDTC
jgi:hypothetical protein